MITLCILNLKKKHITTECFDSKDKAEKRLQSLETNPEKLEITRKKEYLDSYSYDEESEKSLIEQYLPHDRLITEGK